MFCTVIRLFQECISCFWKINLGLANQILWGGGNNVFITCIKKDGAEQVATIVFHPSFFFYTKNGISRILNRVVLAYLSNFNNIYKRFFGTTPAKATLEGKMSHGYTNKMIRKHLIIGIICCYRIFDGLYRQYICKQHGFLKPQIFSSSFKQNIFQNIVYIVAVAAKGNISVLIIKLHYCHTLPDQTATVQ